MPDGIRRDPVTGEVVIDMPEVLRAAGIVVSYDPVTGRPIIDAEMDERIREVLRREAHRIAFEELKRTGDCDA